jgi:hypothetical protein
MDSKTNKKFRDVPLSESNVSLKLIDIQNRCSLLRRKTDLVDGLSLDDPFDKPNTDDPYSRG